MPFIQLESCLTEKVARSKYQKVDLGVFLFTCLVLLFPAIEEKDTKDERRSKRGEEEEEFGVKISKCATSVYIFKKDKK